MDSEEQLSTDQSTEHANSSKGKERETDGVQPRVTKNKNPYEENFNEIIRRENVMKQRQEHLQSELDGLLDDRPDNETTLSINHGDSRTIPSEYNFVMLSKAHLGLNPHSKDPAARVYGFFKTRQTALCHLNDLKRWGVDVSDFGDIHLAPRMKWVLIPSNKEKDQNAEYTLGKIEKLRTLYVEERERANRDFEANRGGKSTTKGALTLAKCKEKEAKNPKNKTTRQKAIKEQKLELDKKVETDPTLEVANIPRSAELRGQNHIVVAIWKDYTNERIKLKAEPEPAILFIDCFDQLEDAKKCLKKTLSKYVRMLDMDIVDLYDWIYPEETDPKKLSGDQEAWRDEEQSLIMKQQKDATEFRKEYEAEHMSEFGTPAVKHDVLAGDQKEDEIRPADTVMSVKTTVRRVDDKVDEGETPLGTSSSSSSQE